MLCPNPLLVRRLLDCSTVRITGVAKNAIQKLTRSGGEARLACQDKVIHNLTVAQTQLDEVRCVYYAKAKTYRPPYPRFSARHTANCRFGRTTLHYGAFPQAIVGTEAS